MSYYKLLLCIDTPVLCVYCSINGVQCAHNGNDSHIGHDVAVGHRREAKPLNVDHGEHGVPDPCWDAHNRLEGDDEGHGWYPQQGEDGPDIQHTTAV